MSTDDLPVGPMLHRLRETFDAMNACLSTSDIRSLTSDFTDALRAVIEWSRTNAPCVKCNSRKAHRLSSRKLCDECLVRKAVEP